MLTSSRPSASTPAAMPSWNRPPGSSTRMFRPRVAHKAVYSARRPVRSVSPKSRDHARYLRSRPARIPASNRVRSRTGEPSRRSEVAGSAPGPGGGRPSGPVDTLRPTPTTTAPLVASAKMPANLPGGTTVPTWPPAAALLAWPPVAAGPSPPAGLAGPASTSFGHLSPASTAVRSRTAAATATPASSGSQPSRARGTWSGRSSTEKVSAARGGEVQVRPSRPRPASCCSAARTVPSGAPAAARASRSALVEPVTGTTSTDRHRPPGRTTAAASAPASRGAARGSSRGGSVTDADAQAAEALALALDLGHLDAADRCGAGHVGAAVGLLVQADDVDDPDLLDLRRDQVGGGPDDVGQGEGLVPGQHPRVDAPVGADLGVARRLDRVPEAVGHVRQVEVHPRGQRLHVPPGDQRPEVAEHHAAQNVQAGVGAHQRGAPVVLERAADRGAWWRQRVTLGRDQVQVVALARAGDAGLHPAPQQHAVIGRLAAAAGVERRPVQDDALGVGREHGGVPLAQRLVV